MKISLLKKPLFLIGLILSSVGAHAKVVCKPAHDALLQWRSSDRYIPGGVLRSELELFLKPETREGLAACSIEDILTQLEADKASLGVDRADAENLLKIRALNRHMASYQNPFKNFADQPMRGLQDEIEGLPQSEIDALIASRDLLESNPDKKAATVFDFRTHMLIQQSFKHATDNDAYAFTVPGVLFALGMHNTAEVVMEVSTRGADLYPYMVAGGQDQIIDMLEQLHFERWQVEFLKQRVTQQFDVPDAFWEYLLNWRFKGEIRGVPTGTIVFPGEPLLQVITDPVSALIVESLINPWMSSMTNLLTAATRIMVAADGIPVSEAGTRRVATGRFSAYTAALAGATGTSNMLMAYLLGTKNYGTMPHATFGMFESEYEAFETIFEYAKGPVLGLPDTYDMETGMRAAIMAAGEKLGNVRQDSNVWSDAEGRYLGTVDSALVMANVMRGLGRGEVESVITNDLRENTLAELAASKLKVAAASIGGGFAAPDVAHGNMVYKLVEFRDKAKGITRFPIKIANGAKSTVPGLKDTVRLYGPDGKVLKDINLRPEEEKPAGKVLQQTLWKGTSRVVERSTALNTPEKIAQGLAELPAHLTDIQARVTTLKKEGLVYPVEISQKLQDIVDQAKLDNTPPEEKRVLVVPGFFDAVTPDGHIAAIEYLDFIYQNVTNAQGFDEIVIVPARDSESASDKTPRLNQQTRISMLEYKFRNNPKVIIWDGEVNNRGKEPPRTYETLQSIQERMGKNARLYLGLGEDTFWSIGRKQSPWKDASRLLREFDITVLRRLGTPEMAPVMSADQADTEALLQAEGFIKRPNRWISPVAGKQIQFLTNRELMKKNASSTQVRKFYDEQKISWVLHVTDPQWTFAMRSKHPGATQMTDGALAVAGTEKTIDYIVPAVKASYESGLAKVSISGDAHFEIELSNPAANGEFHEPYNFPRHGMKDTAGPEGDAMIEELDAVIPPMIRVKIPAHREASDERGAKYLEMTSYDLEKIRDHVKDPKRVLHFEKNGPGSYNVFVNPRYEEYLKMIDPHKMLPHFHNAWAMDFCTYAVTKRELELGYSVYIIIDGTAGVFPHTTGPRLRELRQLGARFVTTREYLTLVNEWNKGRATWDVVLNDIADFEKTSITNKLLDKELQKPQYSGDPADAAKATGPSVFQRTVRQGHMHTRLLSPIPEEMVSVPVRGGVVLCEEAALGTPKSGGGETSATTVAQGETAPTATQ